MARFNVGDRVKVLKTVGNCNCSRGYIGTVIHLDNDGMGTCDILVEFDEYIDGHDGIHLNKTKGKAGHCWWVTHTDLEPHVETPNKIVITTDGKTTTAKMYRDKTLLEVQTSNCHPNDTFDFKEGARVAFDRLVGAKTEEAPKGTLKIEIGKKYKLKDYDKVISTIGISRVTWEKIQKAGAVTILNIDYEDNTCAVNTCHQGMWFVRCDSFECEWEEPIKYYNGKVVCVDSDTTIFTTGRIYEFVDGQLTDVDGTKYPSVSKIKSFEEWQERSWAKWLEVVE